MTIKDVPFSKLCYALTREDPVKFMNENKDWVLDKKNFFDDFKFHVYGERGRFVIAAESTKKPFEWLPSFLLCAAGYWQKKVGIQEKARSKRLEELNQYNLYFGKTKKDGAFADLAKGTENIFNLSIKKGDDSPLDWDFTSNTNINLEESSVVVPVAKTILDIGLLLFPEKRIFDGAKFILHWGKADKAIDAIHKIFEKSRLGYGVKYYHAEELKEHIEHETEHFHDHIIKHSGLLPLPSQGQVTTQSDHSGNILGEASGSQIEISTSEYPIAKSALKQTLDEMSDGKNSEIDVIEKAVAEIKKERVECESLFENTKNKFKSLVEKLGDERFSQLFQIYSTRIAFELFEKMIHKGHLKSNEQFIKESYETRVNGIKNTMIPPTPMNLLNIHHTAQQTLSPYWNLYDRFRARETFIKDYEAMEKDLEQRLEKRSKLLNEADACEAQLKEQDRMIHGTYHSLLKHREKAMSHLDFLGKSINFISPLLEAELPGAGYALHGAQGLIGLGMSEHGAHKSILEKKYQQNLSAAEQNHYQLQNTKGTLTQQVNIINQNIMQHRLLLLQSAEMADPSDYLIKLRESIDKNNQKIQDEEKSIKNLQTNIEFNTDMASKLDKQSADLLTDHNRKHHKERYQDGINQRNQANELRNKNIQLKLELTTKQENLGAIKRAGDECQEVLEKKSQTENLDLFFYNLVRDEVNSQLSQDPKTATIRETVFREWHNYQFAKGQRVNAVNQMFMASDGVIGELTALAVRWNQPDLAKYGQKGQILMNMGRNLYVVTDCYSTMSAGLSSITKILEDNSGSTFIDAVKLMGPTNFLNFCLNPGLQVLSAGLGCIRLGSYLFGNSSTVNDGLSHLHQVLQSVSDQIHFQMNQIHENLKFQDQKTEKLFKEMSDQIEILHKDITNEIRISKEAILSEIDLKKNLDEAEKLQEKSEKIRNEVSKLCDKMISSEDHSKKSKYAVKLMSLLDAELRNSLSNSSRGLINVRDKLGGEKIIRPVVSVHAVIEYPHLFSAVLAKYVGLKSEVPNTDLLLTIIDCYTSSIQTFPKETIEKNTPLIEKIEESIRTQSKMVRNLFDFIDKYTQKVYKQQVKVLNSWKKQLHNNAILDNQFEINAFISAVKNMPANVEISGKERYKLAELLKNTSIYQPELGSSLVGDTGKSVGVVGTSVGAGGAVAISGKVGLAIGAISVKASATLGLSVLCPVAGITLAGAGVTAGVIYGAVKAGQHFVEWLNEPTDEQIAILKKLTPANFMCESDKLAPLSGKKVVKIEFHFDADGKCQYIFEQPPKEKKEDDENVHLLSVSKILRESNKHDTTVFKNSLISISEASKVQDVDLPENLNEYEKAATELVNTYKSWLKKEAGIESGGQLDNPFDVFLEGGKPVTSLNPTLVSLVFPKKLLDHCEHLLSYEKCVMSMKGAGGLAPSYRFEKRNDKYVLTLDYHYINSITKEQLDIQGFEILEVDAVSVESFSNSEVSGQDPVVNLNQFLIQAMYTSALSSEKKKGTLGIPGNATVIFNGIKQIVPSEREFPGFYMLMKKNPREKIIFNCWDFDAQKSQEIMNYAFTDDCLVNPLVTFRITACALAQSYKFKRVTKEVGDKLADNLKALKNQYNNLHAFLCFASSLSDVEIKMALERYSGIIEPTNVETLLQLISADLLPFNVDPKEKVAPSDIIQSFLSSEIKKISEFTHL